MPIDIPINETNQHEKPNNQMAFEKSGIFMIKQNEETLMIIHLLMITEHIFKSFSRLHHKLFKSKLKSKNIQFIFRGITVSLKMFFEN